MARKVASGEVDLEKLRTLEDEELRRALLSLPGIGEKVVECVMLFAYGLSAAFPVDVWIGRAMRGWYFRRRKVSDKKIREFARKYFGPYCGWAQQYLYCFARWHPENS
jgi:N-glycosylase/DNA lyase